MTIKKFLFAPTAWRLGGANGSADVPVRIVAGLTPAIRRAAMTLLATIITTTAFAGYGWYSGAMSIGGATTDCTAWSTSGDTPTDLGNLTDMTITSIAFNVWSDANDRSGANMYFRIWNGGDEQVGSDQNLWLGSSTRIEGKAHDFAISWTGTFDLADEVGLNLEPGKTYYIDMWAKTYGSSGDEWYSGTNNSNYHAKLTYVPLYTVTFNSNGGSIVDAQKVPHGQTATAPTPTMEGGTFLGWTLNGADYDFSTAVTTDITLVAKWSVETYYVDADGTSTNVTATTLTGAETFLAAGTYLVSGDITYDHKLKLDNATVNIILANGKTMSIGTEGNPVENHGIMNENGNNNTALNIYGQTTNTDAAGSMEIYSNVKCIYNIASYTQHSGNVKCVVPTNSNEFRGIDVTNFTLNGGKLDVSAPTDGIKVGNVTINGGVLNATKRSGSSDDAAIYGVSSVSINGGQVTATATNGGQGIKSDSGDITLGYSSETDFIDASSYSVDSGKKVKVKDGLKMEYSSNNYEGELTSEQISYIGGKKLQPVTTRVYFYINYQDGSNPAVQTVGYGLKVTEPTIEARMGYNLSGWYTDSDCTDGYEFDFNAPVSTIYNIALYAKWTPITYYVEFDKNAADATGTMDPVTATYGQWTDIPACTFNFAGHALKEWNTAADGTGESYAPGWPVYNLANEQDAVVTLYAQWGKDISTCTAEVPDQTKKYKIGEDIIENDMISYKFENANSYSEVAEQVDAVVKDGNKTLTLGTDYMFGVVTMANGDPIDWQGSKIGDECRVEIKGMGDYAGSKWAYFMVTAEDAGDTWGDLAWSFHAGTLTINKKNDVTGNVSMNATTQVNYPWFSIANYIKTVTLGEGVTSIAAEAFAGTSNVHSYGSLTTLNLPTSLTSIESNAFAFCSSLTIDLDAILAENITIGDNAFYQIGCLTSSLADKGNNATKIALLMQANANVTLSGRTLYKDDHWNTICLPFGLGNSNADEGHHFDGTLFEGATVMELNGTDSEFDTSTGTLKLNFSDAKSISAGTPYIIKWASGDNLVDPEFTGVSLISDTPTPAQSTDNKVYFRGNFSPAAIAVGDKSSLFLSIGKDDNGTPDDPADDKEVNTLYYPGGTNYEDFPGLDPAADADHFYLGAFRAWFHVDLTGNGAGVRHFVLNFGDDDETTGVSPITVADGDVRVPRWYTLDGVRLDAQPTKKGLYIHGGKKVVIK